MAAFAGFEPQRNCGIEPFLVTWNWPRARRCTYRASPRNATSRSASSHNSSLQSNDRQITEASGRQVDGASREVWVFVQDDAQQSDREVLDWQRPHSSAARRLRSARHQIEAQVARAFGLVKRLDQVKLAHRCPLALRLRLVPREANPNSKDKQNVLVGNPSRTRERSCLPVLEYFRAEGESSILSGEKRSPRRATRHWAPAAASCETSRSPRSDSSAKMSQDFSAGVSKNFSECETETARPDRARTCGQRDRSGLHLRDREVRQ